MQLTIYSVEFNPSSRSYDPFCFKFIAWFMVIGKLLDLAFNAGNCPWIPYIGLQTIFKYQHDQVMNFLMDAQWSDCQSEC